MSAPAPPKSLGKYHLIAELGHGGMADVYLAAARGPAGFSKLQVIKQLRPALAENHEVLAMFLDEARLAARLNHPNVVQTFEVEQQDEGCFIAMEYLDGQPLDRVLRRARKQGGLPLPMVLRVLIDTLAGLHHAHELLDYDGTPLRVVHRDVSPQNIFVTYEGQVKVVDFGIAKAANGSTETRTGVLKGKLAYMPPEQATSGAVDARTDLFAVGVLLVEGLTGQKFWGQATDIQILHRLSGGELPSLPADLDVPPALRRVSQRALARSPSDRYPGAAAMQADLEAVLASLGGCSAREVGVHVAQLFADRRTQARAVIDEQLRLLRSSAPLTLARPGLSQTMSVSAARPAAADSSHPRQTSFAAVDTTGAGAAASPPAGPSSARWVAVACAAVAVVAAGFGLRSLTSPPAAASAPTASSPAPSTIELRLGASPPEARLFLDDVLLTGNPFVGRFPRDGGSHRLRAEAPGFVTQAQILAFDEPRSLDLALVPVAATAAQAPSAAPAATPAATHHAPAGPRPAPAPAASSAPAPPASSAPAPPPPPPTSNRRQLDKDDPWQ